MIYLLQNLGIDVVDIANNHIYDYMDIGMDDTKEYLTEHSYIFYAESADKLD